MASRRNTLHMPRTSLQTRSSERAAASVLNQVSYLLLMIEELPQSTNTKLTAYHVEQQTGKLAEFVQGLIHNLHRFKPNSLNEYAIGVIDVACNQLDLSSRNLQLTSTALVDNLGPSNRATFKHHLNELQQCIYQVFMSVEEVEDKKLTRIISWIKELLRNLSLVVSLVDLVKTFKQYTEALLILFNLIAKQQRDLKSNSKRRSLGTAALTIKKLAPSINKCCQTCIKHPQNFQAKDHKTKVFAQMTSSLNEIIKIIEDRSVTEECEGISEGLFVSAVDQVLTFLKDKPLELDNGEFELLIGAVTRHSMSVINLSDDSEKRRAASQSCITVLSKVAAIIPLCKNSRHHSELQQTIEDFKQQCELLITEMHDLERNVNSMLIESIVVVFKETKEPLDRLAKAVLSKCQRQRPVLMEAVQPYIDEFCDHASEMYQVAILVANNSSNAHSVKKIFSVLSTLEKLDADLLPSILDCPQILPVSKISHVQKRWIEELCALVSAIDEISDSIVFTEVTVDLVVQNGQRLKVMLKETTVDIHQFVELARAQLGLANHLVTMVSQQTQESTVNLEQLERAVAKLREVISGVKRVSNLLSMDEGDTSLRDTVLKKNDMLERCLLIIKSILNEEMVKDSFLEEADEPGTADIVHGSVENIGINETHWNGCEEISDGAQMWLSLEPTSNYTKSHLYIGDNAFPASTDIGGEPDVNLSQVIQDLLKSALGCDVTSSELYCNELMETANNVINVANSIVPYMDDSDEKCTIKNLVSVICAQTVKLSPMARQLAQADVNIMEELNLFLNEWSRNVESLEYYCDQQLGHYLKHTSQMSTAVQLNNLPLLTSARQEFERTNQMLNSIMTCGDSLPDTSVVEDFKLNSLRLQKEISQNLNGTCKVRKFTSLCRQWACNLFSATKTISAVVQHKLLVHCNMNSSGYSDCLGLMEHSIKYIWSVLSSRADENTSVKCRKLVDDMVKLLEDTPYSVLPSEDNFNDLHSSVLTLRWSAKVVEFLKMVDTLLEPHCGEVNKLAHIAVSICNSHKDARERCITSYEEMKSYLRDHIQALHKQCDQSNTAAISHSNMLWKISTKFDKLIEISESLTLERLTGQLLTEYKTEQRLFVVYLFDLRQQMSSTAASDVNLETFDKILGPSASTKPLDSLLEPSKQASSATTQRPTVSFESGMNSLVQQGDKNIKAGTKSRISENSFTRAVRAFKGHLVKWADEANIVVKAAKDLATHLQDISLYVKYQEGPITGRRQLFDMSQQVISHSFTITKFCGVITKYSFAGKRFTEELLYYSNLITFYSEQLSILTSVKLSTSPFDLTLKALSTNGDNLLNSILKALESAESILLKGLREPPTSADDEQDIYMLAIRWRRQLEKHRHAELNYSDINDLGLRVLSRIDNGPHLSEICRPSS